MNATVAHPEPIQISDPVLIRAMRATTRTPEDLTPITISMKRAAVLLPKDTYSPDEYAFQGPVKGISTIETFGQAISRMEITVARFDGCETSDFNVILYVGKHVWQTVERPAFGCDVGGTLWLQGYLAEAN